MINDLWYNNAVIYCLSVGAFMDSDGNGFGDFRGSCAGWTTWTASA
jgi:maltose alpha-D-glucosyltransferase / alpha-amylase